MFTKALLTAATTGGLLFNAAYAHMVITSPVPYGQSSLTNSPLENDGSDFPCKQRSGVYDISSMNNIPVGVPQTLAFKGGATHGGGSCQISVTLDKEPTKDSEWKVIHTILGGCPNDADGNAAGSSGNTDNPTFQYSMPKGMPNGQYTLAWTWFNKIGNREMYMNCAPITVTGGADNNDVYNTLPDMFVINLPREECETAEMEDFVFPSPGLYVETYKNTALGSSTSGANCAAVTIKGKGAGNAGDAASATAGASGAASSPAGGSYGSAPAANNTPAAAPSYAIASKGVASDVAPQPSGAAAATITTMATVTASAAAPSAPAPTDAGSSNGSSSSTGSCSGGAVSCTNHGSVVCIGSSSWGMCNGECAVPMSLAAGTSCSGGQISKRRETGLHLLKHLRRASGY